MSKAIERESNQKITIALFIATLSLVILPFFFAKYIPATDLPQHLAQIRLLQEILANPDQGEYTVKWLGANTLVYGLLQVNWFLFEHVFAGKMTVLELALAWVLSIFALAKRKQRSMVAATLACIFIFNASLYWGFLNFLIGWPVFILWYLYVIDAEKSRSTTMEIFIIISTSFLLFFAHALWLLGGIALLFLVNLLRKRNLQQWIIHGFGLVPIFIWSAFWFLGFAVARSRLNFELSPYWQFAPWERLNPRWLLEFTLGGLRGPIEAIIGLGVVIWIALAIITNWGQIRERMEKELFLAGILLMFIVILAPEEFMNTIYFAPRWAPIAMIFFLLALPAPRIPESTSVTGAIILFTVFSTITCYYWNRFEKKENSGLEEALQQITDNTKVVGLDFVRASNYICGYPFLQTFAYAQVIHGGELNFSFAEHHSGIVSYAHIREHKYTVGLEWYPERVGPKDMKQFDYALINGTEYVHRFFSTKPELKPLMTDGRWRLYRCTPDTNLRSDSSR